LALDLSDPKTKKTAFAVILPIIVLYLFYAYMLTPRMKELEEKREDLSKNKKEYQQVKMLARPLENIVKEIEVQNEILLKYDELLPTSENVFQLIDQLSETERRTDIVIRGFKATETVDNVDESYISYHYDLVIEGRYHNFAQFLAETLNLPRILSFKDMNFEVMKVEEEEEEPPKLQINCTLISYAFLGKTGD